MSAGRPRRNRCGAGASDDAGLTLIEVLVVVAIGSVITGAILLSWFALGRSYALTTSSSEAREFARDAVARLARELRDAEPDGVSPALRVVTNDEVIFTTTFNDKDNELVGSQPALTRYWYEWDDESSVGTLHRQRDTDHDGKLFENDGITRDPDDRDMVLIENVMNQPTTPGGDADIFRFTYVDELGNVAKAMQTVPQASLPSIYMVGVSLSVDMNPQTAPRPMDLSTTVQLRNQSRF